MITMIDNSFILVISYGMLFATLVWFLLEVVNDRQF